MSDLAPVHRYPCGCQILSASESCDHVDATEARERGFQIGVMNAERFREQRKQIEQEKAEGQTNGRD